MIKFEGFTFTDDETGKKIHVHAINGTVSGEVSADVACDCSFYAGLLYAAGAKALQDYLKDKNITS